MQLSKILLIAALFLVGSKAGDSDLAAFRNARQKCNLPPGVQVRCSTQFSGVCAFFQPEGGCSSKLSQKYSANSCVACSDPTVKYYEEGECTGSKVYCDTKVRPEMCTDNYAPVCAYSAGKHGKYTSNTAGNACSACSNPSVEYFLQGECAKKH